MTTTAVARARSGFKMRWRYVIIAALLLPVLAHLFIAITRSPLANYYVTPDEIANSTPASNLRVGGPIVPGSIEWNNAALSLTFQLQGDTRAVTVTFRGMAPDSFRDGATVIAEGTLNPDGSFAAYNLLVKCPHNYVAAP